MDGYCDAWIIEDELMPNWDPSVLEQPSATVTYNLSVKELSRNPHVDRICMQGGARQSLSQMSKLHADALPMGVDARSSASSIDSVFHTCGSPKAGRPNNSTTAGDKVYRLDISACVECSCTAVCGLRDAWYEAGVACLSCLVHVLKLQAAVGIWTA